MGRKLYVGNLPFTTTDEELNEIFAQSGQVASAKIILDRNSGRSKGFGFVEMNTDEEAQKAISQLNGVQIGGRPLMVNEARPIGPRTTYNSAGNSTEGYERSSRGGERFGSRDRNNSRW